MRSLPLWLALVVACGAGREPRQPVASKPAVMTTGIDRAKPPAPVSCGDAGVILRGEVEDERSAGPEKEAAIARACFHDGWPADVLQCIGSSMPAKGCLDRLSKPQRLALHDRLLDWQDNYPDEMLEDDESPIDDEEEAEEPVECRVAIGEVSRYPPALTSTGTDRELATAMRRTHLLELCEDWSAEARGCLAQEGPIARCRALLEVDQQQELADRLDEIDALMTKIDAVRKRPAATFDCKRVVHAHYGDAKWKGKLEGTSPKDRKRLIAASRAQMLKACTDARWSSTLRACVIAEGSDACFEASAMPSWEYPASSIPVKTGIAECDAYGDVLRALAACTAIPRQAARSMLDAHRKAAASFASTGPAERTAAASSCKQADAAIREAARNLGCTI